MFHAIPAEVQQIAIKNYRLWRQDPRHPSLHFRPLQGADDLYTVRIGKDYRAIGQVESGTITWTWIGTHADYNRLVR
jgi:hypothetical protein